MSAQLQLDLIQRIQRYLGKADIPTLKKINKLLDSTDLNEGINLNKLYDSLSSIVDMKKAPLNVYFILGALKRYLRVKKDDEVSDIANTRDLQDDMNQEKAILTLNLDNKKIISGFSNFILDWFRDTADIDMDERECKKFIKDCINSKVKWISMGARQALQDIKQQFDY